MNVLWILLITLVPIVKCGLLTSQTNESVTTELLLKRNGYPYEAHTVTTKDGYILELHRIPHSPSQLNSSDPPKVAFLMHGLGGVSSDFVILKDNSSLGNILSDNGFDVWMGNARGNKYSKKHTKLSTASSEFWNFSWHEISVLDLPAMIDYVCEVTGVKQVRYLAHSQGTTNYLALVSTMPEWNDRFKSVHLLAPVAFISNADNNFLNLASPVVGQPIPLRGLVGSFEFKPSRETVLILKALLCNNTLPREYRILCDNSQFLSTEFNKDTVRFDSIPDLMDTLPSSLSAQQYIHYMQEFNSGHFRQYDHGLLENLNNYGTASPPDYDLKNVKKNVYLYYGKADKFVNRLDLDKLIDKLVESILYIVPRTNFDHLSFLYAPDVVEMVYTKVMRDIESSP